MLSGNKDIRYLYSRHLLPSPNQQRPDWYLEQLVATKPYLPKSAQHVVSDGFYSKIKWVDGVTALGLDVIGKLRCDAALRYVYSTLFSFHVTSVNNHDCRCAFSFSSTLGSLYLFYSAFLTFFSLNSRNELGN